MADTTSPTSNPNIGGVDFSTYPNWQKVQGASGQTYYVIPGNDGYVYDPFLSSAKGRPIIWVNPSKSLAEQNQAKQDAQNLQNAQLKQLDPLNQLIPVGGTVAGLYAAHQLMGLGGSAAAGAATGAGAAGASTAGAALFGNAAADVIPEVPSLSAGAFGVGASGIGDAAAAGTVGATDAAGTGFLGSLGAGDALGTGLGWGPLGAIAAGTILGGKGLWDEFHGKTPNLLSRGILDVATGGLNEIGLHFLQHKSTRDVQAGHTQDLLSQGQDNQDWQNYVQGMRQQNESAPPDPSKPFDGKYATFDEYKQAGLDPSNLTGVYGNLQTFGPDWAKLTEAQRQQVTKGIIDAGLYDSKKGEVIITDPERAKQIKDQILNGAAAAPKVTAVPLVPATAPTGFVPGINRG